MAYELCAYVCMTLSRMKIMYLLPLCRQIPELLQSLQELVQIALVQTDTFAAPTKRKSYGIGNLCWMSCFVLSVYFHSPKRVVCVTHEIFEFGSRCIPNSDSSCLCPGVTSKAGEGKTNDERVKAGNAHFC
jgi:hypothetical protein